MKFLKKKHNFRHPVPVLLLTALFVGLVNIAYVIMECHQIGKFGTKLHGALLNSATEQTLDALLCIYELLENPTNRETTSTACRHVDLAGLKTKLDTVIDESRAAAFGPHVTTTSDNLENHNSRQFCTTEFFQCPIHQDVTALADGCKDVLQYNWTALLQRCSSEDPKFLSKYIPRYSVHSIGITRLKVPNIVHYVWFGQHEFRMLHYFSFLSVERHIKPDYIFLHGDVLPSGRWWDETLKHVHNIVYVNRARPHNVHGKRFYHVHHSADLVRLQILLDYGGIYLDTDVLVVKSFDPLRKYDLTLGRETSKSIANGVMIAKRNSPFIRIWLETYRSFKSNDWAWQSTEVPHKMAILFPHLIHIEGKSLMRPNWAELSLLYDEIYNWSENYAVHVWWRRSPGPKEIKDIFGLNTTLGQVMRYIYFGVKDIKNTPEVSPV